jgi:hypothetical protein
MKTKRIPFDINKAKAGAKVVTRCDYPVKIGRYNANGEYPIRAIVEDGDGDSTYSFTVEGKFDADEDSELDLFIEEEVEEDDDYDPYKATVESIADMVERYSELQSIEELKDFYNNVRVKCQDAFDYGRVCMINQDEEPDDNKPKFKVGDVMRTLEEAKDDIIEGLPVVVSIDDVNYHCNNETIAIKDQDDYEYPPMNRLEINPDKWYVCTGLTYSVDDRICFQKDFKYLGADILKYDLGFVDLEYSFYFRPWTIKDAKPGDILYSLDSKKPFIFKHKKPNLQADVYCGINIFGQFFVENTEECIITTEKYIPADKFQCEHLFQVMKEAGYEWDPVKKELKKVKPKFQEGDWVIFHPGCNAHQILRVVENATSHTYGYDTVDNYYFNDTVEGVRLWNINDAKDGDVLYSGEVIFIFNRIKGEWIHCYCTLHRDGSFISENYDLMHIKHCKEAQPATKEQRELFFQKMKETGYEWDSDKKELHKIGESKTRLMTHQELADWLRDAPEEHREYRYAGDKDVYNTYDYPETEAKTPVDENRITIRRNHGEWQKPLIEE